MTDILLSNKHLCEKLKAHTDGLQHYAFSVFLFNSKDELLLQQRAYCKYHSGGLWSNSCCSHFQNINEFNNKEDTVKKRLHYELGIHLNNNIKLIDVFEYNAKVGQNLIENEIDYIYVCHINDNIYFNLNMEEVCDIKFINIHDLKNDINKHTTLYTEWLKLIVKEKF